MGHQYLKISASSPGDERMKFPEPKLYSDVRNNMKVSRGLRTHLRSISVLITKILNPVKESYLPGKSMVIGLSEAWCMARQVR